MKKNLFQRLQRVRLFDFVHILLFFAAVIPALFVRMKRQIWLVSETADEARDNGYWFFLYVRKHHPNEDIVYAIGNRSPDKKKMRNIGETVEYGSFRHWVYYLACSVKLSSQKSGRPNDAVCYMLDRIGLRKKEVFLQHGVIKDDLPYVHADKAKFSLFVTSAEREFRYVNEHFGFHDGVVQKLGLCRFDDLHYAETDKKLVLIMPTWRQWIANHDIKAKDAECFHAFKQTEYFRKWKEFLSSNEFLEFLSVHGMTAVFYPHRHMQKYIKDFKKEFHDISIIEIESFPDGDVHELLKKASVLITDYSSVAMDFAYMEKPVIYYQFDYKKFRKYHLPEGYFDYNDDGFGPICHNLDDVIKNLKTSSAREMCMEGKYRKRAERFFDLKDASNCKRTYEAVKQLVMEDKNND